MLRPSQVAFYSKKAVKKNHQFRTWLKMHADPKDLDERFRTLHEELFGSYDCNRCRNCCKVCNGLIPVEDIDRDAAYLHMTSEEFREQYLDPKMIMSDGGYSCKHLPCDFLQEDGSCMLGDCKPETCKLYPYTDQPDRLDSMLSFLDNVAICPVCYEICERLKQSYGFR